MLRENTVKVQRPSSQNHHGEEHVDWPTLWTVEETYCSQNLSFQPKMTPEEKDVFSPTAVPSSFMPLLLSSAAATQ